MRIFGRLLRNRRAGESSLAWHADGLAAPDTVQLSSPDFDANGAMPERTAGKPVGSNISPALAWSGVPAEAKELVLVVEDPDAPLNRPFVHAVARLDPSIGAVAAGDLNEGAPHQGGRGEFGRRGYSGPRPVPGHGPHSYVFQLFALDTDILGDDTLRPATVISAMKGHVIARGRLTGTYER
jgi:Raf kinase inhibitor-like YbhB/YbcL family protein